MRSPRLLLANAAIALVVFQGAVQAQDTDPHPVVVIDTSSGTITVELDREKAPISVANFLKYVDKGFYDGLIFHRVIPDFMIQGGGMTESGNRLKEKKDGLMRPIKNESTTGVSNVRGTITMARTNDPDSATSQFFINRVDNNVDNGTKPNLDNYGGGYAGFGKVIEGIEVVDAIATTPTTSKAAEGSPRPMGDVPVKAVTIKSIKRKVKP